VNVLSPAFSHTQRFAGVPAVRAALQPSGRYAVRVQIPAVRRPGLYEATARCGGRTFGVVTTLHVLPA
jgi:hypothetical protein